MKTGSTWVRILWHSRLPDLLNFCLVRFTGCGPPTQKDLCLRNSQNPPENESHWAFMERHLLHLLISLCPATKVYVVFSNRVYSQEKFTVLGGSSGTSLNNSSKGGLACLKHKGHALGLTGRCLSNPEWVSPRSFSKKIFSSLFLVCTVSFMKYGEPKAKTTKANSF